MRYTVGVMSVATASSSIGEENVLSDVAFDLSDEAGVLDLLRRVHLSSLPLETKNQLRDIIFTARSQKQEALTGAEEASFIAAGIPLRRESVSKTVGDPIATSAKNTTPVVWYSRVQPTFAINNVSAQSQTVELAAKPVSPAGNHSPVLDLPATSTEGAPSTPSKNVAIPLTSASTLTPDLQSSPAAVVSQTPVPSSVAANSESTIPADQAESSIPATEAAARINVIKREVNTLVGNPVNLIDEHNEIGREYMNALLDAMKKTAIGVEGQELARVMSRLEAALQGVTDTFQPGQESEATVVVTPPEIKTVIEAVKEDKASVPGPESVVPELNTPEPTKRVLKVASVATPSEEALAAQSGFTQPEDGSVRQAVQAEATESPRFTPVAKAQKLDSLLAAQKEEQQAALRSHQQDVQTNPFMTEDVTQGLYQLLSEWKLFKSSGLFGTGPSGNEHPLYKKLAPLTMAALLAGRFEGATPEIRQNIAEYMNGWRYEEGITHELGETFELYLRRVIRHILDKKSAQ